MNHVLEHVKDPEMLMNNIKSKLQPNGHLIMATPNAKAYGLGTKIIGLA